MPLALFVAAARQMLGKSQRSPRLSISSACARLLRILSAAMTLENFSRVWTTALFFLIMYSAHKKQMALYVFSNCVSDSLTSMFMHVVLAASAARQQCRRGEIPVVMCIATPILSPCWRSLFKLSPEPVSPSLQAQLHVNLLLGPRTSYRSVFTLEATSDNVKLEKCVLKQHLCQSRLAGRLCLPLQVASFWGFCTRGLPAYH